MIKAAFVFAVRLHSLFRALIALLIFVPMAMPWAAAASGQDLSRFVCNPSGQAQSVGADEKLVEFLTAIGEIDPDKTERQLEHCSNCVILNLALLTPPNAYMAPPSFFETNRQFAANKTGFFYSATGPPLGGRAPPFFQ